MINYKVLPVLISLALLLGCTFIPTRSPDQRHFTLSGAELPDIEELNGETFVQSEKTIMVQSVRSSRFLNSRNIIFSREPNTRGFYQRASWAEPPPEILSRLILESVEHSNLFKEVVNSTSSVGADLALHSTLTDFHHDIMSEPGVVVAGLRVELVRMRTRSVVATKTFSHTVPASTYDSRGAVAAFNVAAAEILKDVLIWLAHLVEHEVQQ